MAPGAIAQLLEEARSMADGQLPLSAINQDHLHALFGLAGAKEAGANATTKQLGQLVEALTGIMVKGGLTLLHVEGRYVDQAKTAKSLVEVEPVGTGYRITRTNQDTVN